MANVLIIFLLAIFILFLPGFFLSLVFFKWKKIDLIERLTLSFALSIAIVPLVVFYSNLLSIAITPLTIILQVATLIFLTGVILMIQHLRETK